MDNTLQTYNEYCDIASKNNNVSLFRYEDMVLDFSIWLQQVISFIDLSPPSNVVEDILKNANFKVEKEDKYSHKRRVLPGDSKEKLKPETIEKLNVKFSDVLSFLNYEIN